MCCCRSRQKQNSSSAQQSSLPRSLSLSQNLFFTDCTLISLKSWFYLSVFFSHISSYISYRRSVFRASICEHTATNTWIWKHMKLADGLNVYCIYNRHRHYDRPYVRLSLSETPNEFSLPSLSLPSLAPYSPSCSAHHFFRFFVIILNIKKENNKTRYISYKSDCQKLAPCCAAFVNINKIFLFAKLTANSLKPSPILFKGQTYAKQTSVKLCN